MCQNNDECRMSHKAKYRVVSTFVEAPACSGMKQTNGCSGTAFRTLECKADCGTDHHFWDGTSRIEKYECPKVSIKKVGSKV